jgi:hypothetical protein
MEFKKNMIQNTGYGFLFDAYQAPKDRTKCSLRTDGEYEIIFVSESTDNWTQPPRVGRMRLSDYLDTEKQIT